MTSQPSMTYQYPDETGMAITSRSSDDPEMAITSQSTDDQGMAMITHNSDAPGMPSLFCEDAVPPQMQTSLDVLSHVASLITVDNEPETIQGRKCFAKLKYNCLLLQSSYQTAIYRYCNVNILAYYSSAISAFCLNDIVN